MVLEKETNRELSTLKERDCSQEDGQSQIREPWSSRTKCPGLAKTTYFIHAWHELIGFEPGSFQKHGFRCLNATGPIADEKSDQVVNDGAGRLEVIGDDLLFKVSNQETLSGETIRSARLSQLTESPNRWHEVKVKKWQKLKSKCFALGLQTLNIEYRSNF